MGSGFFCLNQNSPDLRIFRIGEPTILKILKFGEF